jgi:hypothetical protein
MAWYACELYNPDLAGESKKQAAQSDHEQVEELTKNPIG